MFLSEAPAPTQLQDVPAGFFRVLEYLHVPSRFVGTETWLNPASFGQQVSDSNDPRFNRQPPFNRISSYRDPGRVNLNKNVYFGLMHGDPATAGSGSHPGPAFESTTIPDLVDSRRGFGVAADNTLTLEPNTPTFFANPFRSSDAGTMVPIAGMLRAEGVECTVLRSSVINGAPTNPPLFAGNTMGPGNEYRDTDRNPYFRYQPMTRLSNLVTTRSNVYAVWVTIGFFEVEELSDTDHTAILTRYGTNLGTLADARTDPLFQRVYPDGYLLSQEAGSETGDITRIREFAVIDRTVPVAFEPGRDHNTGRAVRLRRRID